MAGIGFELKKVASRGGLGSFGQVAFSGILIVAGPWLISILNIFLLQTSLQRMRGQGSVVLIPVLVYSYALSLGVFGGFHLPFTRLLSDLVYRKKEALGLKITLRFGGLLGIVTTVAAYFLLLLFPPLENPAPGLTIVTALFFGSVNLLWIIMLFASALKWFMKITFAYLAGLAVTQISLRLLPGLMGGEVGVVTGFFLGHLVICLALILIAFLETGLPEKQKIPPLIVPYFKRYIPLFWTGFFLNAGIWIDKVIYWAGRGSPGAGLRWPLYAPYDVAVYMANLIIIPGLIFFVVISETNFYVLLKKALHAIGGETYAGIQKAKYRLLQVTRRDLGRQTLVQAFFSLTALIFAPWIVNNLAPASSPFFLILALGTSFAHLLFLTLVNFLFYMEAYGWVLRSTLLFFVINGSGGLFTLFLPLVPPGLSYIIAALVSSLHAGTGLIRAIKRMERTIYIQSVDSVKDILGFFDEKEEKTGV